MRGRIRILVADDHGVVRQGLRDYIGLQEDMEVVGEAADGVRAVAAATRLTPDIVLMDLVMPGLDGVQATREIRAASPSTRVIILTSFAEPDQVFDSIKAGAAGYLMKDIKPADLATAIRGVYEGEPMLHPQIARMIMREYSGERDDELHRRLTSREMDVLRCIARGMANKEIAAELAIAEKTVKTHVSSILQKLHLSDRTQAALYAVRRKLAD
jgi:two-component system, NarL family, response regulator LiaR